MHLLQLAGNTEIDAHTLLQVPVVLYPQMFFKPYIGTSYSRSTPSVAV